MTAPAPEKAAPIPAEVLAERLRGMMKMAASSEDGFNHLTPAACRLLTRVHEALADRASQEERIREDERDRLFANLAGDGFASAGARASFRANGAMLPADRARLRGDAS